MFHVILYQPEIPPNTGNIIRLCANLGAALHLVHPLGFELDAARVKRAGLDYHELTQVQEHADFDACISSIKPNRVYTLTTRATRSYHEPRFEPGDAFVFGPETRGLPQDILDGLPPAHRLRIPMRAGNRSMNLSNAVAVLLYEAWRQQGFEGAD